MHQELYAYLMRDDGQVWQLPTDELLLALDQLTQAGAVLAQRHSSDSAAVYVFLQTSKRIMRTAQLDGQASEKASREGRS